MPTPRAATFRALHASGCFVLPNPWDKGSARVLELLGFKAVATTSAGFAFSRALPDSVTALSRDEVLAHCRDVVSATTIPVNADFQDGYAKDPEGVARSVALCVETGVAGLSIEDATGDPKAPLYAPGVAVERLRAARAAIDASKSGVVLTARCEAALVGAEDPVRVIKDRLVAFAEAGADCLFAPGVKDPVVIAELVRLVAPKPLNVLVSAPAPGLDVAKLAELGVRRISVGSALARTAWAGFLRAARTLAEKGSFEGLGDATSFAELNGFFDR
jgi:2-methylisocitrate lyase-like PEP mutase family enzyme